MFIEICGHAINTDHVTDVSPIKITERETTNYYGPTTTYCEYYFTVNRPQSSLSFKSREWDSSKWREGDKIKAEFEAERKKLIDTLNAKPEPAERSRKKFQFRQPGTAGGEGTTVSGGVMIPKD